MSARRVWRGIRPSFSVSLRDISEPPSRPPTRILMPFAPRCMVRCAACDQLGIELRLADLGNIHPYATACQFLEPVAQLLNLLAAAANDDTGLGCVNGHRRLIGVALDLDLRNAGVAERTADQ